MTPTPVSIASSLSSRNELLALAPALAALVGGRVSTKALDRLVTARDQSALATAWEQQGLVARPADLVAWPSSVDEVCAVVQFARAHRLALVPFGAGSGRVLGTAAVPGSVCVDLKRLDTIDPVDVRARTVRVGAGVLGVALERGLNAKGWTTGLVPSSLSMSTVGGWLATRATGQLSSRFGSIDDVVCGVSGVFGTGARFETPLTPTTGPDLTRLLIGSEGTLCIFTSAVLRVAPLAERRAFRAYDVASFEQGLEVLRRLRRDGVRPAVARLTERLDDSFRVARDEGVKGRVLAAVAGAVLKRPQVAAPLLRLAHGARIVVVLEGFEQQVELEARAASAAALSCGAVELGEGPAHDWFRKRFDDGFHTSGLFLREGVVTEVLSVFASWSVAAGVVERVRAAVERDAVARVAVHDVADDGCGLHFTFAVPPKAEAIERVAKAAIGVVALEGPRVHLRQGVGALRGAWYHDTLKGGRHALAALKRQLDPDGVLNPGKLGL